VPRISECSLLPALGANEISAAASITVGNFRLVMELSDEISLEEQSGERAHKNANQEAKAVVEAPHVAKRLP